LIYLEGLITFTVERQPYGGH